MELDDIPDYSEPEAEARVVTSSCRVGLAKSIKDQRKELGFDPVAIVPRFAADL
jgi:hypothetical protein